MIGKQKSVIGNPYDHLDRNRARSVVFYGRVSTEHEAQLSALENQMQWYDDQIKYHPNWTVVDRYIDVGITGTQARKRPSFLNMMADARKGKFDLIVTREVCRFARNTVDTLNYTRELKNIGIEVFFVEDNIWTLDGDGEMRLSIMATLAQDESRKVSERVKAGQQVSRENGTVYGNGNILGYNRVGDSYVINPEQAETVRMIFDMYLSGEMGSLKISNELIRLGKKNSSGIVKWPQCTILRILSNPTYMGYQAYGKSYSNNYLEQKRINNHKTDSYMYVKADFEPIVTEEEWKEVEKIRRERTAETFRREGFPQDSKKNPIHGRLPSKDLWVNKMRCSCGASFRKEAWHKKHGKPQSYAYKCYNQLNNGSANKRILAGADPFGYCNQSMITDWKMNLMAQEILNKLLTDRKGSIELACRLIRDCYRAENRTSDNDSMLRDITASIEKLRQKKDNLLNMRAEGEITKEEYAEQKKKADDEIETLQRRYDSFTSDDSAKNSSDSPNWDKIRTALDEITSTDSTQEEILRKIVSKVIVDDKTHFRWYLNLGKNEIIVNMTADGRKTSPVINLDEESGDDPLSPLHNIDVISVYTLSDALMNKNSLFVDKLYRLLLRNPSNSGKLFTEAFQAKYGTSGSWSRLLSRAAGINLKFSFSLDFDTASSYRHENGHYLRRNQWEDINVEVYISG